jgi:hypothetical protein
MIQAVSERSPDASDRPIPLGRVATPPSLAREPCRTSGRRPAKRSGLRGPSGRCRLPLPSATAPLLWAMTPSAPRFRWASRDPLALPVQLRNGLDLRNGFGSWHLPRHGSALAGRPDTSRALARTWRDTPRSRRNTSDLQTQTARRHCRDSLASHRQGPRRPVLSLRSQGFATSG